MDNVLKQITGYGMIPVLNIQNKEDAIPLAEALTNGGLPLMEVMFRTEAAAKSIESIAKEFPSFCVGAGTVLTVEQARDAKSSGAKFIVSPNFDTKVVEYCLSENIPVVPGCITPSEVWQALSMGLEVLKFFPAIQMGGLRSMQLLSGPYPKVRFVPTGDLTRKEMNEYLSSSKVAAVGGDFMLSYDDINSRRFDKIEQSVRETILDHFDFHIAHLGVNCNSDSEAKSVCEALSSTLMQSVIPLEKCYFSGTLFEVLKTPFFNKAGHVAIGTRDAERAYLFLKAQGIQFHEETVTRDENGRVKAAYLSADFGGFALHLLQHER
jgi:2-dehydro-3-deoxyphosphogluconate aldolase / (4S)-4-hydroxy-2-oxoglutarate aldolase